MRYKDIIIKKWNKDIVNNIIAYFKASFYIAIDKT